METTITPNGEADENGVVPATMGFAFKAKFTAQGHKREDGLTAAQVEQEINQEREARSGS